MSEDEKDQDVNEEGVQFSGAMDELVKKYDEVINEFNELLDRQTRKIFHDPDLEDN